MLMSATGLTSVVIFDCKAVEAIHRCHRFRSVKSAGVCGWLRDLVLLFRTVWGDFWYWLSLLWCDLWYRSGLLWRDFGNRPRCLLWCDFRACFRRRNLGNWSHLRYGPSIGIRRDLRNHFRRNFRNGLYLGRYFWNRFYFRRHLRDGPNLWCNFWNWFYLGCNFGNGPYLRRHFRYRFNL